MMYDLAQRRARLSPNRLAVEDLHEGTRYTYRELNERAARFAAAARDCWGLKPGERVAWLGYNRAEFFAMLFGCAKAGLILVPLNWRLAVPELEGLLADAQPRVLIYADEFAGTAASLATNHAQIMQVGLSGGENGTRNYVNDLAAVIPDLAPHPERSADTPWYLLYTSGTTGKPKGVIQTFRMMLANYWNIGVAVDLRADDTLLNVLPMFHTAGINLYSTCMFLVGGCVLVQRQFDPAQALNLLNARATVFFGVPAIYQALLQHPAFDPVRLARQMRSWGCGGAALPVEVARHYHAHGILIRTGMGMTEAGPTVFLLDQERVLDKPGSVGQAQLLVDVRVVDGKGDDVATGQAGELLIRGPGVTPGYWHHETATREAILPGGWLRSGDIVRCDDEGDFYIVDRAKDMVISGGENVYPKEVENVLYELEPVAECAVFGIPDDKWGEVLAAYVLLHPQAQLTEAQIVAHCEARLARFKRPRLVRFVDSFPKTPIGKIQKNLLREKYWINREKKI